MARHIPWVAVLRAAAGSNVRSRQRAHTELGCESLEERRLLTAAPLTAAVNPSASPTDTAGPLDAPPGEVDLYRSGQLFEAFVPATDSDADRGAALRTALAATQAGDELVLGAYTYDTGNSGHVEFPDGVTVAGAGQGLTQITNSAPQWTDGAATFTLNNNSVIQNLSLEGTLRDGNYQVLVGYQGGPTEDVTAYLRHVDISGDSDGIFVWTGSLFSYTIDAYDCNITTCYDAVAVLGSDFNPETVNLYNCSITVAQPDPIGAHISNCVNLQSGNANLYGCTLTATGDVNSIQTDGILDANQGSATVVNCTFNVSAPAGAVYDLNIQNALPCIVYAGQGSGPDGTYTSSTGTQIYFNQVPAANLAGENIFYNDSYYDGNDPLADAGDNNAIAPDKTAYLAGSGQATFANITSYDNGINGVMVDLAGFHGSISANDFTFQVGNNNSPAGWATAPAPASVVVLNGAGLNNSDRVEIAWSDGTIENEWLEVTLAANANTNLAAAQTFFYGNLVGDTGLGDPNNFAITNATDELTTRSNQGLDRNLTSIWDFNRDGVVNAADQLIARNNAGILRFINLAAPPAAPSIAPPAASAVPFGDAGIASASPSVSASVKTSSSPIWSSGALISAKPLAAVFGEIADADESLGGPLLDYADAIATNLNSDKALVGSLFGGVNGPHGNRTRHS